MVWSLFKPKAKQPALEQLSFRPSIWRQANFLTADECEHLIRLASPQMEPSTVIDPETGEVTRHQARTSSFTFLRYQQDPVVAAIEVRLAEWLKLPLENGEDLQVLHYGETQQYVPHYDFFNANLPGRNRELAKGGQRMVTVLLYLNDVEAGGETTFPKIELDVPPDKGTALVFYNTDAEGTVDFETWHGSKPVISGEKWVATKWVRQGVFPR